MSTETEKEYTFEDIRAHRTSDSAWVGIHGKVYDITEFIPRHPGGSVILNCLGRDGTVLYETHHNLLSNPEKVDKLLEKLCIGKVKDYVPIAKFDTPFALKLLERCRESVKGKPHRDSFYTYSALLFFFSLFFTLVGLGFYTGSYIVALLLGGVISAGHLAGHAGNHWSVSSHDWVNKFVSVACTSLWGLREYNWGFSHLISHHCYNYTDRDYIMEQHVPLKYFRVRETDVWQPIHAYQHLIYLTTPITAFFVGAMRADCAPWIFIRPILAPLFMNSNSPMPAPQFFASGSNTDIMNLKNDEDGVGPRHFTVFSTSLDDAISMILSNLIWMPMFFWNLHYHGFAHAVLFNSITFGTQAAIITRSLFTQHMCEDIKLQANYEPTDDWYAMQVEASTSVKKTPFQMWFSYAISFQTEHHMFPSLNPLLLIDLQPIVKQTSEEFGVQYNYLESESKAMTSVYNQFKKLSVKPVPK